MTETYYSMTELVKLADNLIAAMPTSFYGGIMAVRGGLASLPATDVVPVRHGRWINIDGDEESHRQCSECLQDFSYIDGLCYLVTGQRLPRYCPNCGARMDGDGDGTIN